MKKLTLILSIGLLLLIAIGCAEPTDQPEEPISEETPPAVEELQTQPVPEVEKEAPDEAEDQPAPEEEPESNEVTRYRGMYFEVEFPSDFIPSPTAPVTDEAIFTSPDGTVEFFVFSPLWAGDPETYLTIAPNEALVSERSQESESDYGNKIVQWVTVKAQDNSYYRSFVSIHDQVGTESPLHHVFGIKYADNAAYERYKDEYIAFKESLRQYAD